MNYLLKHHWIKKVLIIFLITFSFGLSSAYADPGDPCNSDSACNVDAGELCVDGVCEFRSLDQGGTGLSIPTGDVEISGSIVQTRSFGELIMIVVNYFIGILGLLATIVFVYAGVLMVLRGSNDEQVTKARNMMLYAALGLVLVMFSYAIVRFITSSAGDDPGDGSGGGTGGGVCEVNADCPAGQLCEAGICSGTDECSFDSDCADGFFCSSGQCIEGEGDEGEGVTGGETEPVFEETLNEVDETVSELSNDVENLNDVINDLPDETQEQVESLLENGFLDDKIAGIETLIQQTDDPEEAAALEQILSVLERLAFLRDSFDQLRDEMPESADTIESWDKASQHLNEAMDDPKSPLKFRRFEQEYNKLRNLIRQFPVVLSKIQAKPGEGNVPMTVTFSGLGSLDPTGGTVSNYNWSYLDNQGQRVFIGNEAVVTHTFNEVNTYSVELEVQSSRLDDQGYKMAADGVSSVRVRVNPPASNVQFRVNGAEPMDVYHVTLEEARAGIAFDPSITTPAFGRTIEKYEWNYGDGTSLEVRSTPTTVVHSYDEGGEYFVTLEVTDDAGETDKKQLKLFIKPVAADISIEPLDGNVNTTFTFNASQSRSDDGAIRDFQWTITDDQSNAVLTSDESVFSHRFDRPGEYKITLLVTDVTGSSDQHVGFIDVFSRKPLASFTNSIPQSNLPNKIAFSAANSYDPDPGDAITYSWDFNNDGSFEVVDNDQANASHSYIRPGEYTVSLLVKDSFGQTDQIEKVISVNSTLSGDIVLDKKAVPLGEEIVFEAQSPSAVAYFWEFGDGQTTNTEEDQVTHIYSKEGKYKVTLHFFDVNDNSNTDTTYILVGKEDAPIASATVLVGGNDPVVIGDLCGEGLDGILVSRSDNILLSGESSLNRDGSSRLLSYSWDLTGGVQGSRKEFTHRFNDVTPEGNCSTAELTVRDQISGELSQPDTLYFKVENELPDLVDLVVQPVPEPQPDRSNDLVTPLKVSLRAVNPHDPDGSITKYRWWYYPEGDEESRLGLHSTTTPNTEMVVTAQGLEGLSNTYYFVLEMTDVDGGKFNSLERFGELTSLEVVNGPNLSPVADFTLDKTTISVGDTISFSSLSYDQQGETLPPDAFSWDFDGDGDFDVVGSGPFVNRQFNTPGKYEVILRVSHRNLSSTARKTIEVQPTNSFPQAAFTYQVNGNEVIFDGSMSRFDDDISDNSLRYEWDFDISSDENGNGNEDDDVQSVEITPRFTYLESGLYRVRLKVTDNLGAEGVIVRDVNLSISNEEREQSSYQSIRVDSPDRPLTTLDLMVTPISLSQGNTADVVATIQNADRSAYTGKVFFDVIEGGGEFSPDPVIAQGSKAAAVFTATESGLIRIRITATETFYGDLSEEVIINVN